MVQLHAAIDEVYHRDPIDEDREFICRTCLQVKSKIQDVRLLLRAGFKPYFLSRYKTPECDDCYQRQV